MLFLIIVCVANTCLVVHYHHILVLHVNSDYIRAVENLFESTTAASTPGFSFLGKDDG